MASFRSCVSATRENRQLSGRHVCVADEYDDCMHWCWRRLIGMDPSGIYTICDEACSAKLSHSAIIGKLREISSI
ncbi:hypothetical protein LINGRAHAP2_LOCUS14309, partial [Linum grandiflorum]